MSRIGKKKIKLGADIKIEKKENHLYITGPLGTREFEVDNRLDSEIRDKYLRVLIKNKSKAASRMQGTLHSLLKSAIRGVTKEYKRVLEFTGTGFRASAEGDKLKMLLGYSHPVELLIPKGVKVETDKETITLSGINKATLGQFAANIKSKRPVEPYKGKGIRYKDEIVRRKVGKAVAKAEGEAGGL